MTNLVNWKNSSNEITSWNNVLLSVTQWENNLPPKSAPLWQQTLLSQYNNSPTIMGMLESFNDAVNPTTDIANFYSNIWNVNTAVGYGLDVWGAIVNVSRYLQIPISPNYLGFKEAYLSGYATTGPQPFGQAPFYNSSVSTQTYALTDDVYRKLILIKAAVNISNISVPNINKMLRTFFGTSISGNPAGVAYVIDTLNQGFTYHFNFVPNTLQLAIVQNSNVFPRPSGVNVTVTY